MTHFRLCQALHTLLKGADLNFLNLQFCKGERQVELFPCAWESAGRQTAAEAPGPVWAPNESTSKPMAAQTSRFRGHHYNGWGWSTYPGQRAAGAEPGQPGDGTTLRKLTCSSPHLWGATTETERNSAAGQTEDGREQEQGFEGKLLPARAVKHWSRWPREAKWFPSEMHLGKDVTANPETRYKLQPLPNQNCQFTVIQATKNMPCIFTSMMSCITAPFHV